MTTLRIVVVYPDLLGTYGDGGNGLILARRAAWRGTEVELVQASIGRSAARRRDLLPGGR
jgi:CobQ-like glutamine amidotransferase family enzyme